MREQFILKCQPEVVVFDNPYQKRYIMLKFMIQAIEWSTSSIRSILVTMLVSVLAFIATSAFVITMMTGCSNNAGNEDIMDDASSPNSTSSPTPAPAPMPSASAAPPPPAAPTTRNFTVVFEGSPAGRLVLQRHCEGSPVSANDVRPDKQAQFKPWPDQDVNARDTWRSFGGDVTSSYATYSRFVSIPQGTSLRFQCYDNKGDPSDGSYGCTTAGVRGVRVYENGVERTPVIVTNLVGSANCQVN